MLRKKQGVEKKRIVCKAQYCKRFEFFKDWWIENRKKVKRKRRYISLTYKDRNGDFRVSVTRLDHTERCVFLNDKSTCEIYKVKNPSCQYLRKGVKATRKAVFEIVCPYQKSEVKEKQCC